MSEQPELERLFPGDSEMAGRMRAIDWSATDLGPVEHWPEDLRVAVRLCLTSRFPILLWWGPRLALLYNDAYLPWLTEAKHPRALGRPGYECWGEIWDIIGPMLEGVRSTGQATWSVDTELFFDRKVRKEEVYITWTYAPILAADGQTVEGIFNPCLETTEKLIGARRLETLRKLGIRPAEARTVGAACQEAVAVLAENTRDIPLAAIYVVGERGDQGTLSATMLPQGDHLLPASVSASEDDSRSPWPLASALRTKRPVDCADLAARGVHLPGVPWPEEARDAIVLPIHAAQDQVAGLLVVGISPRRPLDAEYRTFFELVAGRIATAISDARAYEAERRRAEALAELDRAKTAFFLNVSHEFRTPLTLLLGPVEDALADPAEPLPPGQRERLETAHRSGLRLLKLVNTLLDFSRIEAGRVQAVYESTDLAQLTAELASNFHSACAKAGLRLVVDCPPLPGPVYVDRGMWEKVVLNLMEARVRERTADLARTNEALQAEVRERCRAEEARTELRRRLATAQEDERRRISRELHDQVGQQLTSLTLTLKALRNGGQGLAPEQGLLERLQKTAEGVGRAVHDLALRLRPAALDDLGLPAALQSAAEGWSRRAGVEVDFHSACLEGRRLPGEVETTLYRVVLEALHNVLKHARARHVSVILERRDGHAVAIVEDDGTGFDAEAALLGQPTGRLGLLGMRERMALVGGALEVESTPGAGTTVFARIPLPAGGEGGPP